VSLTNSSWSRNGRGQDHQNYMQFRAETGNSQANGDDRSPRRSGYWSLEPLAAAEANDPGRRQRSPLLVGSSSRWRVGSGRPDVPWHVRHRLGRRWTSQTFQASACHEGDWPELPPFQGHWMALRLAIQPITRRARGS